MASAQKSIEVNVPIREAYNQWTQFETFPHFMEGIEKVTQLDDKKMHWKATIGGKTEEWDAVINEQIPDQRVAWTSTTGATNAGVVTFSYVEPDKTLVMLRIDYEPQGVLESAGSALGLLDNLVWIDLQRFKSFIEEKGTATGAWRGTIEDHPEIQQR